MKKKYLFGSVLIVVLFISVSYIIQTNLIFFKNLIVGYDTISILAYILIAILVTIFAPLTSIPLIPLASGLWGGFLTGIYSIIGWFIGSVIAFYLARKYGRPFVEKVVSLEAVKDVEGKISKKKKFVWLIFLRMLLPVDIMTYALGLFTDINMKTFIITTLIGITPFAFALAYLGMMPVLYQIIGFIIIGILIFIGFKLMYKKN